MKKEEALDQDPKKWRGQPVVTVFVKGYLVQPMLLVFVVFLMVLSIFINILYLFASVGRSGPQLDIKEVSVVRGGEFPIGLLVKFRNVGTQPIAWLDVATSLVIPENMSVELIAKTVMANPTPAGADRTLTVSVREVPRVLALCPRWLDKNNVMSKSQWIFVMGTEGSAKTAERYVEPSQSYMSAITRLNPCSQVMAEKN